MTTLREAALAVAKRIGCKCGAGDFLCVQCRESLVGLDAALATPEPDVSALLAERDQWRARAEAWKEAAVEADVRVELMHVEPFQRAIAAARRLEGEGK